MRRALIVTEDPRTATYFCEALARMQVQSLVARSLMEVGPHVLVPPPHLLVLNLTPRDTQPLIEFATALKTNRGAASIFVVDRVESETAAALSDVGETIVLCKPIHREQLQVSCQLALKAQERGSLLASDSAEAALTRQRHLERTLRRIAETVAVAGIGPVGDTYGVAMLPELRPREEEIVRLLLQHVRVPAIAQRLGINQQTVRNHLKGAFKRAGVRSQQELLDRFANGGSPGAGPGRSIDTLGTNGSNGSHSAVGMAAGASQ